MITLQNISKTFETAGGPLPAVSSVSLQIQQGDIYGLIGFSGAGKSTLLRTINLLERPDEGNVIVDGEELTKLSLRELRKKRLSIGMIFQHFNLLHNRNVYDNVSFPLEIAKVPKADRRKRIEHCLDMVGLADKAKAYPAKLSGGQKQRVAIARALASNPKILLCDEPTSSVDPQTTGSILAALKEINRDLGITIVIVTHEMNVVKAICNKVAVMEHGKIVEKFDLREKNIVPKSPIAKYLFNSEITLASGLEAHYA
ncbi:methionine ABC transporter ATP-binding protein [Paenibacillus aestuarii]|uniref:Methionine ABC transporter ATP-binding protein n=1 Tax=Paenibacillus aestuarii TaxID=516965 RepID=A0ABW0K6E4_9BACL|nr:ATP-binding cassette domain-containing protein [Paenibacillus aestuarii]